MYCTNKRLSHTFHSLTDTYIHTACMVVGRAGDRISVRARFSAPAPTGAWGGGHPGSCTMDSRPLFRWESGREVVNRGDGINHPPPSSAEINERVQLYFYSPSRTSWSVLGLILPSACLLVHIIPETISATGVGDEIFTFVCKSACAVACVYTRSTIASFKRTRSSPFCTPHGCM